jgi:phage gpG-like protein
MTQITVRVDGAEKLVASFGKLKSEARLRVKRTIWLLSGLLVEHIQRNKLSGQYLHQRTGRLAGSIHNEVDETPDAIIGTVGTNVIYARIHEYGFSGSQAVKAHMRTIKQAWGRPISARQIMVSAHSRKVDITEKRFMRDSLNEFRPKVTERMTKLAQSLAQEVVK